MTGYLFEIFLSAAKVVGVVVGTAIGGLDLLSKALFDSAFTLRVSLGGDLERIRFYYI